MSQGWFGYAGRCDVTGTVHRPSYATRAVKAHIGTCRHGTCISQDHDDLERTYDAFDSFRTPGGLVNSLGCLVMAAARTELKRYATPPRPGPAGEATQSGDRGVVIVRAFERLCAIVLFWGCCRLTYKLTPKCESAKTRNTG